MPESKQRLKVRLQRQGVSSTLRATFNPCPHDQIWHIQIMEHFGAGGVLVELSRPNCFTCHPGLLESGQIAASNRKTFRNCRTIEAGKAVALQLIAGQGMAVRFADRVEAYCYSSESDLVAYPRVATDVYLAACYYDETADVVQTAHGLQLVAFSPNYPDGTPGMQDKAVAAGPYAKPVQQAHKEYLKKHNKPGSLDGKAWLAWLISEYIKDDNPEAPIAIRDSMIEPKLEAQP